MDDLLMQTPPKSSTSHRRQSLKLEECLINGEKIKLPQALCENTELFQALFSVDSWNAFTEQQRRHLMQFLPTFGENEIEEKSYTLKCLFSGSEFRFGTNPLTEFSEKLNAGYYRTDIVNMQKLLTKARYKEYLKKQRVYYYKVLKHCLKTRHRLLDSARDLQLGSTLPPQQPTAINPAAVKRKIDRVSLEKRVKHRYFQELISIKKEIGDSSDSSFDENYPEGFVPPPFTKKHRKQICMLEESFNAEFEQPVISTLSRPDCLDLSRLVLNVDNPFDITEDKYKEMVKQFNKHSRNPHPYLKVQSANKPEKPAATLKPPKEVKPLRKRRQRKTPAAVKPPPPIPQPLVDTVTAKTETPPLNDKFAGKPTTSAFTFTGADSLNTDSMSVASLSAEPLSSAFAAPPIKQERLDEFSGDVKPNLRLEEQAIKDEMDMKEQDNAVAALLKQEEEEEAKVNEYIKNGDRASVLLFHGLDPHMKEGSLNGFPSEYLLTPESYNVALHSVVADNNSSFKKKLAEPEKPTPLPEPTIVPEVDNLNFEPLSVDTIAETPFTNSPPVTSGISACGNTPAMARISPSVTDLDNMNVMDLGPLNVEDTEPPPSRDKPPPELMHNAHSSFFSLIREIVCSTWDHRMDLRNLQKRIDTWYDNAVSPLNSWYTNQSWPNLLQNAVTFLAGQCPDDLLPPEYVPYIEYKSNLDIYQWIGAGRDSDTKLTLLCDTWLKNKDEVAARVVEDESILPFVLHDDFEFKREQRATSPASTHFPTDWVVQASSFEEKEDFRKQEKLRFQNPNIPFTYRIHGYQTVVGPVNMSHTLPNSTKLNKGSSLLVDNRPYYVTILSLVQDAAARLPNGEGTRQDIVTLLKDSQFLSQNIMNCILHGAVTSSLERLQLESDPCVKYDARRKVWVYLHRSRTISDFEMIESIKPKAARKTAVWKLRKDYLPLSNVATLKTDATTARTPKELKTNARAPKNAITTTGAKLAESKPVAPVRVVAAAAARAAKEDKPSKVTQHQPTIMQATVVPEAKRTQSAEVAGDSVSPVVVQTPVVDKGRALVRVAEPKSVTKAVAKAARPSIIKKNLIKETTTPASSAASTVVKTSVSETKSILTGSNILAPNTIVKLINAKSLTTTDAVKGAKTISQLSPQQIVVIKQPDDNNLTADKKHTILLKQLQHHPQQQQQQQQAQQQPHQLQQQRLTLASLQSRQPQQRATPVEQSPTNAEARLQTGGEVAFAAEVDNAAAAKRDALEKQKQLQQLLMKHQNELKLQQSSGGVKEAQQVRAISSSKPLPKQMIVVKQNQGQIVAETQSMQGDDESSNVAAASTAAAAVQKQIGSSVVILNKQQYQQQLQNSKHQIIQLSGQQFSPQQIQQMLLKQQQQQQQALKRGGQQQIVMLKPEIQGQQGQQQIVMLKHQPNQQQQQQQQLVMIKQSPGQQTQKVQSKQPQMIQIANSTGLVSPISADLSKLQVAVSSASTSRIQKMPTSVASTILQNSKAGSVIGTTIAVSVSKPTMPTYTVVALGQQHQKVFSQSNQHVQILTPTTNAVSTNQTVVLPTSSGALTLLQQAPMQQVLLPSNFNAPGMINLKTLQGLKVIPITTQSAGTLRGQQVITRLVNSSAIRPVVIQEERTPTTSSSTTNMHQ